VAIATRTELDKPTIRVYEENLKDLPVGAVVRVLKKLEAKSEFFPKLPVIRAGVLDELEAHNTRYLPLGERQVRCATCEDTRFVEAPPELVAEGEKPVRRVMRCPDCRPRKGA
jgi:hypothetical protein